MIKDSERKGLRTWIEVDTKAIKGDFSVFRKLIPKETKIMAVVKSNAYGHSLLDFSREIEKDGADWLAVDSVVEGLALRKEGIKIPILVLGYTLPELFSDAVKNNISLTISNFESLEKLAGAKLKTASKIHIKVDTGMHRQGFMAGDRAKLLQYLGEHKKSFEIEGLFTHFASAKNPEDMSFTLKQIEEFKKWVAEFKKSGFSPLVHTSATAGALIYPEARFDAVRIGIGLYGLWPAKETQEAFHYKISLEPVMEWKTIISEIKDLKKGEKIGYDLTCELNRNSKIAICPVGYWHGYPRGLSNNGFVR